MNIENLIIRYLQEKKAAKLLGFGTFSLEKAEAVLNEHSDKILPPSQRIVFSFNEKITDEGFVNFISKEHSISDEEAQDRLTSKIHQWKSTLQENNVLNLEELGTFSNNAGTIVFEGKRIESENSDFYGLEEINIQELKKVSSPSNIVEKDYQFSQSILWIFLVALPALAILVLGFTQRELLFGKKSFDEVSVTKATHRIEKDTKRNIQSANIPIDSLKLDSLKQDSISKSGDAMHTQK